MFGIRRALLFTATERFIVLSVNFAMFAAVARLLTPEEIGFSVIGAAALGIAESFRDFGATSYIVQQVHLSREGARTASTVMVALSVLVTVLLWAASGPLASFYHKAGLQAYLHVTALTFLAGPISGPLLALLRREMRFGAVAIVNVASSSASAFVTLALAVLGGSSMSFAWGAAAGATTSAVLALLLCQDHWVLRPAWSEWRKTLAFGLYTSGAGLIGKITESVPSLILGKTLNLDAVGYFNRAAMVCQLPDKCLLTGLLPVALPAMAAEVRAGRSLKVPYLRGLSFITAVQWPAFILLAILASPAVTLLLGHQWITIVPLVRIIALGSLATSPSVLFGPTLVAAGALRDILWSALIVLPISALVLGLASFVGLEAAVYGVVVAFAAQAIVSLFFIRGLVRFTWSELGASVWKSVIVAAGTAVPPILILAAMGWHFDMSVPVAALLAATALPGWLFGLVVARHPLLQECLYGVSALRILILGWLRVPRVAEPR